MAPKLRVYNLARELNLDNAEIIRELQHMGVPVTSHSNTVDDRQATLLRKKFAPRCRGSQTGSGNRGDQSRQTRQGRSRPTGSIEAAPHVEAKAEPKIEAKPEPTSAELRWLPNQRLHQSRLPPPPAATVAPPPAAPPVPPRLRHCRTEGAATTGPEIGAARNSVRRTQSARESDRHSATGAQDAATAKSGTAP